MSKLIKLAAVFVALAVETSCEQQRFEVLGSSHTETYGWAIVYDRETKKVIAFSGASSSRRILQNAADDK